MRIRTALLTLLALTLLVGLAPTAAANPSDVTRVAFIGDSFEQGYGAPSGQGYLDLFEAWIPGQDNVLAVAHGGATVRDYLPASLSHPAGPYAADLDGIAPWGATTVVVPLGTNDWYITRPVADYQADLTELVQQIRLRAPTARVVLYHHFGGYAPTNPAACDNVPGYPPCVHQNPPGTWGAFGTAMRAVAVAQFTGYIDDSVAYPWNPSYLFTDKLHPNTAGHDLLFRSIYNRLYACC